MKKLTIIVCLGYLIGFTSFSFAISINPLFPKEGAKLTQEFVIKVKINEDTGEPFTEKGPLRWTTAVIRDSRGVEILRISLRDNGKGEDELKNDGIWTSPFKVKLLEGNYSFLIVVRKGKELFRSPMFKFIVKPKLLPQKGEKIESTEILKEDLLEEIREIPVNVNKSVSNLEKQLAETQTSLKRELISLQNSVKESSEKTKYMFSFIIILIGVTSGIVIWYIRKRPSMREFHASIQSQVPKPDTPPAENWKSLFSAVESLREQLPMIERDLTKIFHMHNKYKDGFQKVLKDIVMFYEKINEFYEKRHEIETIPQELITVFRMEILNILEKIGVEKWIPEVGKPAPDECKKEPAEGDFQYPQGTVIEVLSPGYRIRGDGGFILLKEPKVKVVPYKPYKEDLS